MYGATNIATSPCGKYLAIGSQSGIVSIYDDSCWSSAIVKPVKEVNNIHTSISSMAFNSTSEILAMASEVSKNAIKLVHLKSLTAFSNFPINVDLAKSSNKIKLIDFSPNSGYLMTGNMNGKAPLFRLHHYKGY